MRLVAPLLLFAATAAQAADTEGRFAADGVGVVSCARYGEVVAMRTPEGAAARETLSAWLDGFVSAANALQDDTFDLTPWQSARVIEQKMVAYCAGNPDTPLAVAATALLSALAPDRVTEAQTGVSAGQASLYPATLAALRAAVEARGLPTGDPEGFDDAFSGSLRSIQTEAGLDPTGQPDEDTLILLLDR